MGGCCTTMTDKKDLDLYVFTALHPSYSRWRRYDMHAPALPHRAIDLVVRRKNVFAWSLLLRIMVCQLRNDQPFFAHAPCCISTLLSNHCRHTAMVLLVDGPANAKCESSLAMLK